MLLVITHLIKFQYCLQLCSAYYSFEQKISVQIYICMVNDLMPNN
ncbi:hypothetical protein D083_2995 [Dickeya solani RNS 08.23.3.1.A]|nr:hypothetical protein D083_2995 [Dickeya solani RNS 08.23.3.1.A]